MKVFSCPSGRPFMVWTLMVILVLCGNGVHAAEGANSCKLLFDSESEQKVFNRLEPLTHNNFTVETKNGDQSYTYVLRLCGDAGGVPEAAVVQVDGKGTGKKPTAIGLYNSTQAIGGSDWVMLIYDTSDAHCPKGKKRAVVMISCNRKIDVGQLKVVQEDKEGQHDCFYQFRLDSSAVCPALQSKLSTGSILLIIGFCLLAVYLIGGFLYQRMIVGAKGMEQFPNYAFWVEVGNLTADGCDFVCRSQNREDSSAYRGVAPETLEEEPEERDDHLLPM